MTCDTWHVVTRDTWHVTRDTWHVTCLGGWTLSQNFSSLALTICDLWYHEDLEEKDDSINQSISDKAVYRTAPATPGLLKSVVFLKCCKTTRFCTSHFLSHFFVPKDKEGSLNSGLTYLSLFNPVHCCLRNPQRNPPILRPKEMQTNTSPPNFQFHYQPVLVQQFPALWWCISTRSWCGKAAEKKDPNPISSAFLSCFLLLASIQPGLLGSVAPDGKMVFPIWFLHKYVTSWLLNRLSLHCPICKSEPLHLIDHGGSSSA